MTEAKARVWAGAIHNEVKTWADVNPQSDVPLVIHASVFRGWAAEEVVRGRLTLDQFTDEDRVTVMQALIDSGHDNLVSGYMPPEPDESEDP